MRKLFILLIAFLALTLVSCSFTSNNNKKEEKEEHLEKPLTGIDPIFNEELGYYNENPSVVMTSSKELYIFYVRNKEKNNDKTDEIVVRRATKTNGEWVYGDFKTVLSLNPDKSAWDHKYISSPDVIRGEFKYNGETYKYLMAYHGSNTAGRMNAQIGFAVSKQIDGEYIRVGSKPIITFNQAEYSEAGLANYKGAQEPSLVSYDKKGKIQLFYSFYAKFNSSYMVEMDCSDLNNIVMGGRMLAEMDGLADQTVNTHLYSADFAYNPVNDEIIAVRNYSSKTTGLPSSAEAFQLVYANINRAYYDVNYATQGTEEAQVWYLCSSRYYKVGAIRTAVDDAGDLMKTNGYSRCNNATIFSDEYGWVDNPDAIEVIFTSSATSNSIYLEGEQYKYSQMLHYFKVPFERDEEYE